MDEEEGKEEMEEEEEEEEETPAAPPQAAPATTKAVPMEIDTEFRRAKLWKKMVDLRDSGIKKLN